MKKFYLLGLFGLGLAANAQSQKVNSHSNQSILTTRNSVDYVPASPVRNNNEVPRPASGYGKNSHWRTVGTTMFDRPTNASVYRRIIVFPNGEKSIIWTTSSDGPENGFLSRGSGYNHDNGINWGPVTSGSIELFRTGYPNLDFDPVNNEEIILSHKVDTSGKSGGMVYNTNGSIGGQNWTSSIVLDTSSNLPGVLWPRTVVSGDYLIVIGSYTDLLKNQPSRVVINGVRAPQVYSRMNLTTHEWVVKNQLLPEYDGTRYYAGGGDNYAIAANGDHVAILMGGLTDDIALWKSSDNGENWTKTILDSFLVPAYDFRTLIDTTYSTDGAMSVTLDDNGNAHCFWALGRMMDKDTSNGNTTFSFFPGMNSIRYWYEGRPDSIVSVAYGPEDPTDDDDIYTIGTAAEVINDRVRYGNLSITTAPYSVRSGDTVYLVYQARTDNDIDGQGFAFADIYVVASPDNGASWTNPLNLTAVMGLNTEQTFASVADDCKTNLHLSFMQTSSQGFYDPTGNPNKTGIFEIIYYEIPVADVFERSVVGMKEVRSNKLFSIKQNYPNPFGYSTTIPVSLTEAADVKVTIMNMVGQEVYTKTFSNTMTGLNELEIAPAGLTSGFYIYNVEAGGFKATGKMMAE